MPHLSLLAEAEEVKGSALSEEEQRALEERASYAKFWLSTYAPEEYKYILQDTIPSVELSDSQKKALGVLATYMESAHTGEEIHARLHELKTEIPIPPKDLFVAIYKVFLNRDFRGQKLVGFFQCSPLDFVQTRLAEASE